jgi:hypothetical protein
MLHLVQDLEHGKWTPALAVFAETGMDAEEAARAYTEATLWAKNILG